MTQKRLRTCLECGNVIPYDTPGRDLCWDCWWKYMHERYEGERPPDDPCANCTSSESGCYGCQYNR